MLRATRYDSDSEKGDSYMNADSYMDADSYMNADSYET